MIKLDQVTMSLTSPGKRQTILSNVSIDLPTDQRLVVLGGEGSGKTTFIRLLAGIMMPTSGRIKRYARVSFPVGFSGGLNRKLSVAENVRHAAILYGAETEEVVEFVKVLTGFDAEMTQPVERLPMPLRLRLTYALSYGIGFDTYLVDNMVAAGDADFRNTCEQIFWERMKTSGCIMATKVPKYAKRFATAAVVLHDQTLTLFDDVDAALRQFQRVDGDRLGQAV